MGVLPWQGALVGAAPTNPNYGLRTLAPGGPGQTQESFSGTQATGGSMCTRDRTDRERLKCQRQCPSRAWKPLQRPGQRV